MTDNKNYHVIGLTGQSGAGKSTAAAVFRQNGFAVIDADICAREVVEPGTWCLKDISEHFGKDILKPNGCLDRKKLGSIVFSDKEKLEMLNSIMYPHIIMRINALIKEYSEEYSFILLDAPTLFEAGAYKLCDKIVSVTADIDTRTKRITERDGISEQAAHDRFGSQHDEAFFVEHSDIVVRNIGTEDELVNMISAVCSDIKEMYNEKQLG